MSFVGMQLGGDKRHKPNPYSTSLVYRDASTETYEDAKGQKTAANSLPVVLASDQGAIQTTTTLAANVSSENDLSVSIASPLSAFGQVMCGARRPVAHMSFVYDEVVATVWNTFAATGGTVTASDSLGRLDITDTLGSYAVCRSVNRIHYRPGVGAGIVFTMIFNEGVALTQQTGGLATAGNGYAIGFNGTDFSVLRSSGGEPEVRTLTVTTAENSSRTGTVQLDGQTAVNVTLTNAGAATNPEAFTAYEIASSGTYTGLSGGVAFYADQEEDKVIFTLQGVGQATLLPYDGAYAFSSPGAAVGTFAQTTAAVAKTNTWVAQANFNIDTLDGNGPSGITIDPTKGNVYQIQYQWLGFGAITFSVEVPSSGRLVPFHRIAYANANTAPSIAIPSLPAEFTLASLGGTTAMQASVGSIFMFVEGEEALPEPLYSLSATHTLSASNTEENVLCIRNRRTYRGKYSQIDVRLISMSVASSLGTNKIGTIRMYILGSDATLGDGSTSDFPDFRYHNETASGVLVDTQSITRSLGSNSVQIQTTLLGANEGSTVDLTSKEVHLEPTQTVLITGEGTGTGDIKVSLTWREVH